MMKTGKNKRLLASILAASMLLAMSPFALAEGTEDAPDTTGQGQTVEGGGAEQTCAAKIGETEYSTLAVRLMLQTFMMQTAMSLSSCSMMLRKISRFTGL